MIKILFISLILSNLRKNLFLRILQYTHNYLKNSPEHLSWIRIWFPSKQWSTILKLGLMQRTKCVPVFCNFSIRSWSWVLNLLPTLMKLSLPFFCGAVESFLKSFWMKGFSVSRSTLSKEACKASLFFSMKLI